MRKHIVFDFDGTLVDSMGIIVKVYNELAEQYKFKTLDQKEYQMIMKLPLGEKIKALGVPMSRVLLIRKFSKDFKNKYKSYLPTLHFFDGILDMLDQLKKRGYVISIITSNAESNIRDYLKNKDITVFEYIKSSKGLFGKDKTIKQYMKDHNLKSNELIYIGDEVRDIQASKKIHVEVIAVSWGIDISEVLLAEQPNYFIEDPIEILDIV